MYTVKLMNEFLHSPIWIYNSSGVPVKRYSLIDDDPVLKELNEKAMNMFSGYYEFDSHDMPFRFNHDKEKNEKMQMLDIMGKIKKRLAEINDGSFIVEDSETERLNNL